MTILGRVRKEWILTLQWWLMRLPRTLTEDVTAHELVHLLGPRKDAAFWARLERVLSD